MKIRSAVPENGCLIVLVDGKKQKTKKTTAKHIHIRLLPEGGCVNKDSNVCSHCGPGNAHFISVRQVSLPVDFRYFATYFLIRT